MASLPESRDERIRELWRIWRQLEEENAPEDWTPKDIKDAKAVVLTRLLNECEPEILEAFRENFLGCILCGFGFTVEDGQAVLTDYPEIIAYDGVLRACAPLRSSA